MMLDDLAVAARKSGLPVVEIDGWQTRGHGQMSGVRALVCHHTAGPASGNMPSLNVLINGTASLDGPLSHLGLARDGTVYVIAAGLCWHAGATLEPFQANNFSIGIEAEATGVDYWPSVQYDAYVRLCNALIEHYDLPVTRIYGHKEVCSPPGRKIDPNFDMGNLRSDVINYQPQPRIRENEEMYIKCEISPTVVGTAILSGPMFVAIVGGEVESADANIAAGALVQWVTVATWEELDRRSHALCDTPKLVTVVTPVE